MSDSPSPLSSHGSSEFGDDIRTEHLASEDMEEHADVSDIPPGKRQRTGQFSYRATPVGTSNYDPGEISSDTEGSAPNSPWASGLVQEDDREVQEQITICKWLGCAAGALGNMDVLVQHLHDDHIGIRQKKYSCEWEGCPRVGMNHASGYALRAHMRSHTREKPFFCTLPGKPFSNQPRLAPLLKPVECDKSFTRSDALAKHMRTVHETESLRPSDPVPRNHSAAGTKPQRLKLIVNAKPPESEHGNEAADVDDDATIASNNESGSEPPLTPFTYPADIYFTEEELAMSVDRLYKLLRRQVCWAEELSVELKTEVTELEGKQKEEWQAKELILANLAEAELANAVDKEDTDRLDLLSGDLPQPMLPMKGPPPWYREPAVSEAEAEPGADSN